MYFCCKTSQAPLLLLEIFWNASNQLWVGLKALAWADKQYIKLRPQWSVWLWRSGLEWDHYQGVSINTEVNQGRIQTQCQCRVSDQTHNDPLVYFGWEHELCSGKLSPSPALWHLPSPSPTATTQNTHQLLEIFPNPDQQPGQEWGPIFIPDSVSDQWRGISAGAVSCFFSLEG